MVGKIVTPCQGYFCHIFGKVFLNFLPFCVCGKSLAILLNFHPLASWNEHITGKKMRSRIKQGFGVRIHCGVDITSVDLHIINM
jgi:hypothetical protein